MKNLFKLFALSFIIVFAFSCKDDELPIPTADFTTDPAVPEVGLPVMFENMTINAASYSWDFGDETDPSTEISPSHTYEEAGTYTVILTATTQDGQSVVIPKEIDIKQRLLTDIIINNFPTMNGDAEWDPNETNPDSVYADVMVTLANIETGVIIGPTAEVSEAPFGATNIQNSLEVFLTDEDWELRISDFDGIDIDNPDFNNANEFEIIIRATFNPVLSTTTRIDDETGFVSIFGSDAAGNFLDADIYFVLQ